ncbi:MAG: chain-length determining protein [Prevotella sp.]|nr:chain-length determining protein [Prevotella sp.]
MSDEIKKDTIDYGKIVRTLWEKKIVFLKVWPIIFVISCLWILPQPRYYKCDVMLAPETSTDDVAGSLSSMASSFGIKFGSANNDAIYPELYPDLLSSNEFMIGVLETPITTVDSSLATDYYTYLVKHQKPNWLTQPFVDAMEWLKRVLSDKDKYANAGSPKALNPFKLSEFDFNIVEIAKKKILCYVNKKTEVITITFTDQDPYIAAIMANSVKQHLQNYIIDYRTKKARVDVEHYQALSDSAYAEYELATKRYDKFCDQNLDLVLQSAISKRDNLQKDMEQKFSTYTASKTQLEVMKAKLQEKTPAFTTLKSATVPIKPAGPKRMIFVAAMLILSTVITAFWLTRKECMKVFSAK